MSVRDTTAPSRSGHRTPEPAAFGPTVARLLVQGFVRGLEPCGVDASRVLRRCDLDEASLAALPERVPYAVVRRLFLAAAEDSGEQGLGLRLAEHVRLETWEMLGYVIRSSGTLGDALLRAARYLRLLSDAAALSLHVGGERALLLYRNPYLELALPDITEFVVGVIATLGRQLSGHHHLVPLEVRFTHAPPGDMAIHARHFGAPVHFSAPHDGLLFDAALLHYEIGSRDPRLCTLLEQQADRVIRTLPEPRRIAHAVEALIAAGMPDGGASADRVAAQLKLHPKALARRLHTEGTTFRQLLEAVRREAAEGYLTVSDRTVGEVAFLLGYSEQSAFHKAFRRWTGTAPARYRHRAQASTLGA